MPWQLPPVVHRGIASGTEPPLWSARTARSRRG